MHIAQPKSLAYHLLTALRGDEGVTQEQWTGIQSLIQASQPNFFSSEEWRSIQDRITLCPDTNKIYLDDNRGFSLDEEVQAERQVQEFRDLIDSNPQFFTMLMALTTSVAESAPTSEEINFDAVCFVTTQGLISIEEQLASEPQIAIIAKAMFGESFKILEDMTVKKLKGLSAFLASDERFGLTHLYDDSVEKSEDNPFTQIAKAMDANIDLIENEIYGKAQDNDILSDTSSGPIGFKFPVGSDEDRADLDENNEEDSDNDDNDDWI